MTYVIGQPCVDVRDRACVDECPVDCIYKVPGEDQPHLQSFVDIDLERFAGEAGTADHDTRLQLAQAYLEMGDTEGARELLEEVLRDGDETQRAAAQQLMDRILGSKA